jgi:hypothetical protein
MWARVFLVTTSRDVELKDGIEQCLFPNWLNHENSDEEEHTCYMFIESRRDLAGKEGLPVDIWLRQSDLQDLEHLVVITCKLSSMNSAPDSLPQVILLGTAITPALLPTPPNQCALDAYLVGGSARTRFTLSLRKRL